MTPTDTRRPGSRNLITSPTNRRQFLIASGGTAAAVSMFGLSACGDSGPSEAGSGDVLLNISPDVKSIVTKQIAEYNKANPDGAVTTRITPADTSQAFDQFRTQFQGGGTDIDVIMGDIIWPPQFAANGYISDLSDLFTTADQEAFIPGVVTGNTFDGAIYGVPWFTDAGFLYYRSDLLEKAGFSEPPTTWDELKMMAAKVQQDAGTENGFVFTGAQYEGGTVLGIEFIREAGGDILDGDTVVIDSPEAIEGLTIQQSLVSEGIAPEAVANYKEDEASGAFLRGDAVFMRMWPYAYDLLSDKSQSSITAEQVGLSPLPTVEGVAPVNVGGGFNFFINAEAGDQEAAYNLIKFMTDPEQQKTMAIDGAYLPTRSELYDDPEIIKSVPGVRLGKEVVPATTTPPVSPYYSDMSLAMSEGFNGNILSDTTPEETAANLKEQLESIISKGG
ncbi:MAG: ABC transporter substrate-binding protein [Solirubrobacterales bacterium]